VAHEKVYGLVVSVPSRVEPAKNSTCEMLPSASLALAAIAIIAGAVKPAPGAGVVMATVGGWFGMSAVDRTEMLLKVAVVSVPGRALVTARPTYTVVCIAIVSDPTTVQAVPFDDSDAVNVEPCRTILSHRAAALVLPSVK